MTSLRMDRRLGVRMESAHDNNCVRVPAVMGTQNLWRHRHQLIQPLTSRLLQRCILLVISFSRFLSGRADTFIPAWQWDVSLTSALQGKSGSEFSPMPHYACLNAPWKPYCPNCKDQYKCNAATCPACNALCEAFDPGDGCSRCKTPSDLCPLSLRSPADMSQACVMWKYIPPKCLPRLQLFEGTPSPMATYFVQQYNKTTVGPPIIEIDTMKVVATVKWGYLDVFNLSHLCSCDVLVDCSLCRLELGDKKIKITTSLLPSGSVSSVPNAALFGLVSVLYSSEVLSGTVAKDLTLTISGPYASIKDAMLSMTFNPITYYNSYRIRHLLLEPTACTIQPWFQVDYQISSDSASLNVMNGTFSQLMHVLAYNNAPTITNPQIGYYPGCLTRTPCVDSNNAKLPYSRYSSQPTDVSFGQYWVYEGTTSPILITGLKTYDLDLDELCYYDSTTAASAEVFNTQPQNAYFCGTMNLVVRAAIGAVALNTVDNLDFYSNDRSLIGAVGVQTAVSTSLSSITYREERPEIQKAGTSTVFYVNTQYVGAPQEYVIVTLQDQGLTGADGLAKEALDPLTGQPGLRINITIVASNNAPVITSAPNINAVENAEYTFTKNILVADDPDSDEVITSILAIQDWTGYRYNQPYLNKIRVTLQLKGYGNGKGRGLLYFDSSSSQLSVVSNSSHKFISIYPVFPAHDSCASLPTIYNPMIYQCDEASAVGSIGNPCEGPDDRESCNIIASGGFGGPKAINGTVYKLQLDAAALLQLNVPGKQFLLKVSNGSGTVQSALIKNINNRGVTLEIPLVPVPDHSSNWTIYIADVHCVNVAVQLKSVCLSSVLAPGLEKEWIAACSPQSDANCTCAISNTCDSDGKFLLYLNISKDVTAEQYAQQITAVLSNYRKTCGSMPILKGNTSIGKPCNQNSDCSDSSFPKCIPGVSCRCCANLSVTCSFNSECSLYAASSFCGCQQGLELLAADSNSSFRCCGNVSAQCSNNSDCSKYNSNCSCMLGYGICNSTGGIMLPCTYRGTAQTDTSGTYTMYPSDNCQAPIYSYEGTENAAVFDQLSFDTVGYQDGDPSFNSLGSTRIEFYAIKRYAALAMSTMIYLTNNFRFPNYNRLYRLPVADRDPTTFDITANDYDQLFITVNDMGNSGGSERDIKQASAVSTILVAARNNRPSIVAPPSIVAIEDIPYQIINQIRVTDPDQTDYGFNDSLISASNLAGMGFQVNISVQHGCLFINESFFLDRESTEYDGRGQPILGTPSCSLVGDFGLNFEACTIRLKNFGQPNFGIHAVNCPQTQEQTTSCPCYSSLPLSEQSWCYAHICTKFIAFEGRFPDVNAVLSNVTYLSDPDFNTYYGYTETLTIQVTDNGILGDVFSPLGTAVTIPITVQPVNDAPGTGRLQSQQCFFLNADGTANLNTLKAEDRVFSIDNSIDFVDINEDTVFVFYPDRIWVFDNDAEEALIRAHNIAQCVGDCDVPDPYDPVFGCCQKDACPELCEHIAESAPGTQPSEVLVSFSVDSGYVSFYPPSTRPMLSGLEFLTNLTLKDIKQGGEIDLCASQEFCMRNQSRIWVRGRISVIQNALQWGYLTYLPQTHYVGDVNLNIWISDDGYSDMNYKNPLIATNTLQIQIIGVNNAPTITAPVGSGCSCSASDGTCSCDDEPPLTFSSGFRCYNNWMDYSVLNVNAISCPSPNISRIPNQRDNYKAFPNLGRNIQVFDVDFAENPAAYMTIELVIGRKGVGTFFLTEILTTVEYYQWEENDGLMHLRMKGELGNINYQLTQMYLDIKADYSGPSPILVTVNDNEFYGVCTPQAGIKPFQCKRSDCKNLYGQDEFGSAGYFICNQPVARTDVLYEWIPGGTMACSKIPGVLSETNLRWPTGLWSGPFSCLGCGYYDIDFKTVSGTPEPPTLSAQIASTAIQAVVVGASACQFSTCLSCNAAAQYLSGPYGDGCGWCPSFCGERGKCMIGLRAPMFEICPVDPITGLGYRQCGPVSLNLALILGTAIPGGLLFFLLVYTFVRWIQKRHGTLVVYLKKKHFDIMHHGRKLSIVPPPTASYFEFFVTLFAALAIGLVNSNLFTTLAGPFYFQQEFYLDSSNKLSFILDNCNLRFVPTRNYPFPTSAISALKVRFAFTVDPQIQLIADTCPSTATFEMINNLDPSKKYKNFYCNIEVLVPDRYIMPTVIVDAVGINQTTVRAGPMDADTPDFGLDFGPNEFIIQGSNILARLDNLTANHFEYNVLHGQLLLTNIYSTSFANFNTLDADVVVTTTVQTSAQVWQKSENLVCLSAATLFVDSNCKEICDYVPLPKATTASTASVDFRYINRYYRRRLLDSSACSYVVPGCTNADCTLIQTDQCLCKPVCDMVTPANLDFDGVKGIKGTCNGNGQCCRTICQGYSAADLFPFPNSVRCGICQDAASCSAPTCGSWSAGNLQQHFWFTSQDGQISLSVFDSSIDASQGYNSFNGSAPARQVNVNVDLNLDDKILLDELFHPGGMSNPVEEWFWLRLIGPGAPPSSYGSFAWFISVRFLVLPPYFLHAVTYDTMTPREASGTVRLRPGFCPAYIDYSTSPLATNRIITLYQILSTALQNPPGPSVYPLPFGSLIAWLSLTGSATKFELDSSTNQLGLSPVEPWIGQGPALLMAILLSVVFPVFVATGIVGFAAMFIRQHLIERRIRKVMQENAVLDLFEHMRLQELDEAERKIAEEVTEDSPKLQEMRGLIDIWYVIDCCFCDPDQQKSLIAKSGIVLTHLAIIAGPTLYLNNIANLWLIANHQYYCENRIDKGACYLETQTLTTALNSFVLVFALFSVMDLSFHYLTIAFVTVRRWLRLAYYILLTFGTWLALCILLITAAWILYSAMEQPVKLSPFALAGVCCLFSALRYFAKQSRFLKTVTQILIKRMHRKKEDLKKREQRFPARLVEIILDRNLESALVQNGFSTARILGRTFIFECVLIITYAFILLGFQAFVDFNDYWSGFLNVCIVLVTPYLILSVFQGPEAFWQQEEAETAGDKIFKSLELLFASMEAQLHVALNVIDTLHADDEDEDGANADPGSSEEDSESTVEAPLIVKTV